MKKKEPLQQPEPNNDEAMDDEAMDNKAEEQRPTHQPQSEEQKHHQTCHPKHQPGCHAEDKTHHEIQQLTDLLKRTQAEFENFRKRIERDKQSFCESATKELVEKLLPVLDNFQRAMENTSDHENFVKGIKMIYADMASILKQAGLQPIDAMGKPFDPYAHEALMQEESQEQPNTIIGEFEKGYTFNGKVIRHSKVKVAK